MAASDQQAACLPYSHKPRLISDVELAPCSTCRVAVRPIQQLRCGHRVCRTCLLQAYRRVIRADTRYFRNEFTAITCEHCGVTIQRLYDVLDVENWFTWMNRPVRAGDLQLYRRYAELRKDLLSLFVTSTAEQKLQDGDIDGVYRGMLLIGLPRPFGELKLPLNVDPKTVATLRVNFGSPFNPDTRKVPFWKPIFRRRAQALTCCICADNIHEIDYGSFERWQNATRGSGDWRWQILDLPARLSYYCQHDISFCSKCLATYIATQISVRGPGCHGTIPCPEPTCRRFLKNEEIRLYAGDEFHKRYDELGLLKELNKDPKFQWCLREGCPNGDIFDSPTPCSRVVQCSACKHETCSVHARTLPCSDCELEHGTSDATEQYFRQFTIICPSAGCSTRIEKDGGCFHMTCPSCQHEFCWECLAAWAKILELGRTAHRHGCFFRREEVRVQPTQIFGNDVDNPTGIDYYPELYGTEDDNDSEYESDDEAAEVDDTTHTESDGGDHTGAYTEAHTEADDVVNVEVLVQSVSHGMEGLAEAPVGDPVELQTQVEEALVREFRVENPARRERLSARVRRWLRASANAALALLGELPS
jgi:hypothetical protein